MIVGQCVLDEQLRYVGTVLPERDGAAEATPPQGGLENRCWLHSSDEDALVSMVAAYHTIRPKAVLFTTSAMLYKMFRASVLASSPVPRK